LTTRNKNYAPVVTK